MQGGSILALSPSFNSYSSSRFAEIAVKVSREFSQQREELGLEDKDSPPEESFKDGVVQEFQERGEEEFRLGDGVVEVKSAEEEKEDKTVIAEEKSEGREEEEEGENENAEGDDFEFAVVCRDSDSFSTSADEIFSNGQIRPIYPVFDRSLLFSDGNDEDAKREEDQTVRLPLGKLLIEERDPPSSSSSEADELEGVPSGTYCVWTPKSGQSTPERCKKSNSTGSSKRWRFRNFLLRSNSDGKDTFVFLSPSSTKGKKIDDRTEKAGKPAVPKVRRNSSDVKAAGKLKAKAVAGDSPSVSAHEIHYVRNRALKEGDRRRSYLPYRQDLVGLFANVNGLSRNLHPF